MKEIYADEYCHNGFNDNLGNNSCLSMSVLYPDFCADQVSFRFLVHLVTMKDTWTDHEPVNFTLSHSSTFYLVTFPINPNQLPPEMGKK